MGYQADIGLLGGDPPRNIWGALYDEARRRELLAVPDQDELGEGVPSRRLERLPHPRRGGRIGIWINGYQTVDYTETDAAIELIGIICLQVHAGAAAEIGYRGLEIEPLCSGAPRTGSRQCSKRRTLR